MNSVYVAGFGDVVPFDQWWPALQADPEYDSTLCFVAAYGSAIIGFCHCWSEPFVKDIVVAPSWRGRGVATALLTEAMTTFSARGATSIDLKTDVDNFRAQAPYLRLGFEIVERIS